MEFIVLEDIGFLSFRVGAAQPFGDSQFFAQAHTPGFGHHKGVGTTFDDKLTILIRHSIGDQFATPVIGLFE